MDSKKIDVIYANDVKYSSIWLRSLILCLVLWLAPYLFGKYTDNSFPYIAKEDIVQELVGTVGPSKDGVPWCPVVSPHLLGKNNMLTNDVRMLSEEEIVKKYGIQEGGTWKPKECQSRYQVSSAPVSLIFTSYCS